MASEDGEHNVYRSMAEDMIAAVKDGSVNRLEECLKAFHEMIKDEDEVQDRR
jgi:hypothetical protein